MTPLKIGTRSSPLAMVQAQMLQGLLPDLNTTLVPMTTEADRFTDRPLYDIGGKGLFVRAIDQALISGEIDCAIHCVKDMEGDEAEGITVAAYLRREDPRDVLIRRDGDVGLQTLPMGAVIGTCAPRRQALLRRLRPDLKTVILRGNVGTRLRKLFEPAADEPQLDAIVLAAAGLRRMDYAQYLAPGAIFSVEAFLPAVGQGVLAVVCRTDDMPLCQTLGRLQDEATTRCVLAERALLRTIGGSCRTPLGGYAEVQSDGTLWLRGMLAQDAESAPQFAEGQGTDPLELGVRVAKELLR